MIAAARWKAVVEARRPDAVQSQSQFVSHLPRLQTIMPMPLSVIILCVSIKRFRCESRKPSGRLQLSQTYFGQGGREVEVACMKVEANNPTNANVEAIGKRAFEMPVCTENPKP